MRLAAIDLGSNSFHLVIVDVSGSGSFQVVDREKEMIRLGAGTLSRGRMPAETMRRGLDTLRRYKRLCESRRVEKVLAVATSAIREAATGEDFLENVGRAIDVWPRAVSGEIVPVATLLLTNRECPWKCLMCDLWLHTLSESVPPSAIPSQIDFALQRLPAARQIKLYNSGSFFDARAIPPEDYAAIADRLHGFERVIVECHPALIGERCREFLELLTARGIALEVAMGLETVHPVALEKLNKGVTLDGFRRAADWLQKHDVALRVFALVQPPGVPEIEAVAWSNRTVDFAFDCGASVVAVIPTRAGNGAMETLQAGGEWSPPALHTLEAATDYGIALQRGRVFADLWDLEKFSACPHCFAARRERLQTMNFRQQVEERIHCLHCHENRPPLQ